MPIDPTPHGGEILHDKPEEGKFPPAKPASHEGTPDIAHRPSLPTHTERMAVDIEDEDADPVIDSGPGIDKAGQ